MSSPTPALALELQKLHGDGLLCKADDSTPLGLKTHLGNLITRVVSEVSGPQIQIALDISRAFDLDRAEGVRVVISIGDQASDEPQHPSKQAWYIDGCKLYGRHSFTYMWVDEDAQGETFRMEMPVPSFDGPPDPNDTKWLSAHEARSGSIAVWIERGRLVDDANDLICGCSATGIRFEAFEPTAPMDVFEFRNQLMSATLPKRKADTIDNKLDSLADLADSSPRKKPRLNNTQTHRPRSLQDYLNQSNSPKSDASVTYDISSPALPKRRLGGSHLNSPAPSRDSLSRPSSSKSNTSSIDDLFRPPRPKPSSPRRRPALRDFFDTPELKRQADEMERKGWPASHRTPLHPEGPHFNVAKPNPGKRPSEGPHERGPLKKRKVVRDGSRSRKDQGEKTDSDMPSATSLSSCGSNVREPKDSGIVGKEIQRHADISLSGSPDTSNGSNGESSSSPDINTNQERKDLPKKTQAKARKAIKRGESTVLKCVYDEALANATQNGAIRSDEDTRDLKARLKVLALKRALKEVRQDGGMYAKDRIQQLKAQIEMMELSIGMRLRSQMDEEKVAERRKVFDARSDFGMRR